MLWISRRCRGLFFSASVQLLILVVVSGESLYGVSRNWDFGPNTIIVIFEGLESNDHVTVSPMTFNCKTVSSSQAEPIIQSKDTPAMLLVHVSRPSSRSDWLSFETLFFLFKNVT
jgi:hypothetical protein